MKTPEYDHELKTWPAYFHALERGKNFEVRRDDRGFQRGDVLWLREFKSKSQTYTGNGHFARVTYILTGGQFGIEPGYVVLGLEDVEFKEGQGDG